MEQNQTHVEELNNVTNLDADFGAVPEELRSELKEADPFGTIPQFNPGKPGMEAGKTLAGYFQRSKACYSEKLSGNKRDASGRKFRMLHIFRDHKNRAFGIWGVGSLDFVMALVAPNQFISIQYLGKAKEALKPGQSPAHEFAYKGVNLDLDMERVRQQAELDQAHTAN
jgi:hypothetical protein